MTAQGVGADLSAAVEAVAPSWDGIKEDLAGAMDKRDADSIEPLTDSRFADRSRLMQLLSPSYSMDDVSLPTADRDELTKLVSARLGISPEAARAAYDQWQRMWQEGISRFKAAKEDIKRVAQEAAAYAAKRTAQAAIIAFIAMMFGLGAAIAGALFRSACAMKCIESRTVACALNRMS